MLRTASAADGSAGDHGGHADDIIYPSAIPFVLVHLACFAAVWTGVTAEALLLGVALYVVRMFAVTAGYHRYFAHRTYQTSRIAQFLLAFLAQTSAQRGVLWWAANHRAHHRHADTLDDALATPARLPARPCRLDLHAAPHAAPTMRAIADFTRYPELVWLDRQPYLPAALLAVATWLIAGWPGLDRGLLLEHRAGLARHLRDQLGGASCRPAALPDRRRLAQQLVARDPDAGRGVAQQPSRLPVLGPSGFPLVGVRPDVLRPEGAVLARPGLEPAQPARGGDPGRAAPRPQGDREGGASAGAGFSARADRGADPRGRWRGRRNGRSCSRAFARRARTPRPSWPTCTSRTCRAWTRSAAMPSSIWRVRLRSRTSPPVRGRSCWNRSPSGSWRRRPRRPEVRRGLSSPLDWPRRYRQNGPL